MTELTLVRENFAMSDQVREYCDKYVKGLRGHPLRVVGLTEQLCKRFGLSEHEARNHANATLVMSIRKRNDRAPS